MHHNVIRWFELTHSANGEAGTTSIPDEDYTPIEAYFGLIPGRNGGHAMLSRDTLDYPHTSPDCLTYGRPIHAGYGMRHNALYHRVNTPHPRRGIHATGRYDGGRDDLAYCG